MLRRKGQERQEEKEGQGPRWQIEQLQAARKKSVGDGVWWPWLAHYGKTGRGWGRGVTWVLGGPGTVGKVGRERTRAQDGVMGLSSQKPAFT